ncbi:nuclear transport factor 2 family protein [Lentzea sp. NEAU-D7]|uniref:nuclear transport factor 2 family protein n=1 Tax=Lentzea sp. NEAU-D7 TaxID=2994667 RepID=UPI00224AF8DD|nr:nuclear transport factor 2 family protein [Lentzea sp. NEAU-D7]MCX2948868.1 nuclear transport factor 2 family protein [Lentzea sp. NEAU-D7]
MSAQDSNGRSTRDVLEDHLEQRRAGRLQADLDRNYAANVVTLSAEGVHHGHDAIRSLAAILRGYLPDGAYNYRSLLVHGEVGMLEWSGRCSPDSTRIHDGVDTYLVKNGRIAVQTIHYSAQE